MPSEPNLTRRIVNDLGRAIVTGEFSHDAAFPTEAELCDHYGASRSVLREAVKMLTSKGLLFARKRSGTFVQPEDDWNLLDPEVLHWILERPFSIDLLVDFTQIRLAIEPSAAALAADSAAGSQRKAIVSAVEAMEGAERDTRDGLEPDIAFHVAVLRASNNRFLRQFTDLVDTTLRFSIRRTNEFKGVARASAAEHKGVADAILRGDASAARDRMHLLIRGALDLLLAAGDHPRQGRF